MCKRIWDQELKPVPRLHLLLRPQLRLKRPEAGSPTLAQITQQYRWFGSLLHPPSRFQPPWLASRPRQCPVFSFSSPSEGSVTGAVSSRKPGGNQRQAMAVCPAQRLESALPSQLQ